MPYLPYFPSFPAAAEDSISARTAPPRETKKYPSSQYWQNFLLNGKEFSEFRLGAQGGIERTWQFTVMMVENNY